MDLGDWLSEKATVSLKNWVCFPSGLSVNAALQRRQSPPEASTPPSPFREAWPLSHRPLAATQLSPVVRERLTRTHKPGTGAGMSHAPDL